MKKASAFILIGVGVGVVIGGSIGIAGFGGAIGIPLTVVGACVGLAGYGAYKACD